MMENVSHCRLQYGRCGLSPVSACWYQFNLGLLLRQRVREKLMEHDWIMIGYSPGRSPRHHYLIIEAYVAAYQRCGLSSFWNIPLSHICSALFGLYAVIDRW